MILCSGVFDGLHAGHVAYLNAAKTLTYPGEAFAVAVASDAYVQWHKQRTPIWTLRDRIAVVFALALVDRVMAHGDDGAADAIRASRPRIFVKGKDWEGRLPNAVVLACHDVGCAIAFVESGVSQHTSDMSAA